MVRIAERGDLFQKIIFNQLFSECENVCIWAKYLIPLTEIYANWRPQLFLLPNHIV